MSRNKSLVSAYSSKCLSFKECGGGDRAKQLARKESFEQLCAATDLTATRSFRIHSEPDISQQKGTSKVKPTKRTEIKLRTLSVYNDCPSSISSYRAKKPPSRKNTFEESRLQLAARIQESKSQLSDCNDRIQQNRIQVPAMRVLRNLIRALYDADNVYMRLAFLRWKKFSDDLRQHENSIRQTANRIKNAAHELIRDAINTATNQVDLANKRQMLENAAKVQPNIVRWERTKSMYTMKSDFKPRGSLFKLPDAAKYKVKLHQKKKMLSPKKQLR